jgi:hypothetical protein
MDHRRAAEPGISLLDEGTELALRHPDGRVFHERGETEVAESGTDPHPLDLLVGLAHAQQPTVLVVEIDERADRGELALL